MNSGSIYETIEDKLDDVLQYFFTSTGNKYIIKAIQYTYVKNLNGKKVFNLGFGDYDIENDRFIDDVNSNNGDVFRVFNTVLSTIPRFFESYYDAVLMVEGSDGRANFIDKCWLTCKKKCKEICKNFNRRIAIYCGYINKNFKELNEKYIFYGGADYIDNQHVMQDYKVGEKYNAVFLIKKMINFIT